MRPHPPSSLAALEVLALASEYILVGTTSSTAYKGGRLIIVAGDGNSTKFRIVGAIDIKGESISVSEESYIYSNGGHKIEIREIY